MGLRKFLLVLGLCFICGNVPAIGNADTLSERWDLKLAQQQCFQSGLRLEIPILQSFPLIDAKTSELLPKLDFFFVPGVMNEWADWGFDRYFNAFAEVLDQHGATHFKYRSP